MTKKMLDAITDHVARTTVATPAASESRPPSEISFQQLESSEDYAPLAGVLQMLESDRREAKDKAEFFEARRKDLDDQIKSVLGDIGYAKVLMPDGWVVERVLGRSASKLEPTKLLEQGVAPETIRAATVLGSTYEYVKVREQTKGERDASGFTKN